MRRSATVSRPGARTPRRAGAKKDQILEAAARVFRQKGYDGATLRDIAKEAGLLPGSLYYHIRSKEELLRGIVEQPIQDLLTQLERIIVSEIPVSRKLEQAIAAHLRAFDAHYPSFFVYVQNLFHVDAMHPRLQKRAKRYEEYWQQILCQGIESGEFPPDLDVKVASFALLGMCNWMHRWYRQEGRLSIDQIIQQFSRLVLDGLRRRPRD